MRNRVAFLGAVALVAGGCIGSDVGSTEPSMTSPPSVASSSAATPSTTGRSATATTSLVPSTTSIPLSTEPPPLEIAETLSVGVIDLVEESAGLFRVDSDERPAWLPPGLFQFPDGRLRMVYAVGGVHMTEGCDGPHCVIDEVTRVRVATCVTSDCLQMEIFEMLLDRYAMIANEHAGTGWVAFNSAGIPFLTWTGAELGIPDDQRLPLAGYLTCSDPTCAETVTTFVPHIWNDEGFAIDGGYCSYLTATSDGGVACAGVRGWLPDPDVWEGWSAIKYGICDETWHCVRHQAATTIIEGVYPFYVVDGPFVGFTPEGNPVISHTELNRTTGNVDGQWLLTCTDPACTDKLPKTKARNFDVSPWSAGIHITSEGTTYLALEEWTEPNETSHITLTWCPDTTCDESRTTELDSFPAGHYRPFISTLGADDLPRLVWASKEGFEYTRCLDTKCTNFETTPTGIYAKNMSIVTGLDGNSIIGIVDDTTVSLYRCPNPSCTP